VAKPDRPDPDAGLGTVSVSAIYRGRARLGLIRDLALGEWTPAGLASQLGLPPDDVISFAREFADEIAEVKLALAGQLAIETSGLWITKKQNRLAELQEEFEQIAEATQDLRDRGITWSKAQKDMTAQKIALLRAVADELGAYPQRSTPPARTGNTVHYIIETDDADALK
jgi:hypothetical protein